jgi:hypothetical protein
MISSILPVLQVVLAFGNICVLAYALMKFLSRPHDTLEDKVNAHDVEIREIKASLLQGNDRFREQEDTNEVLIHSVLALIEFEIQYCLTEHKDPSKDLERAKDDLHHFLSKR